METMTTFKDAIIKALMEIDEETGEMYIDGICKRFDDERMREWQAYLHQIRDKANTYPAEPIQPRR